MLVDEMTQLTSSPVTISENAAEEPGPSHPKRTCPLESTVLLDVISEIITDSNGNTPSTTTELENFSLLDYKSDYHCWIHKSGTPLYMVGSEQDTQFPVGSWSVIHSKWKHKYRLHWLPHCKCTVKYVLPNWTCSVIY